MTEMSLAEIFLAGEALSLAEAQRFGELEQVVETGLTVFVQVGNALLEIRDSRLYRQSFPTFEAYCRERWGMVRQQANRLIAAAETVGILEPMGSIPTTERQARPLTRLEPEVQREVWQNLVATIAPEQMTAKIVEEQAKAAQPLNEAVKAIKETLKPEPTPAQQPIIPEPVKRQDSMVAAITEKVKAGEITVLEAAKEIRQVSRLLNGEKNKRLLQATALPPGSYRCIVIDPPWDMQKIDREVRPNQVGFDYPTMTEEQLAEFGVGSIAYQECHLYMWTTQRFLPAAFRLLETWGFSYIFTMVWHKPGGFQPINLPQYNCEFVLFGRRGGLGFLDTKSFFTCFNAPRREHSRKPDDFYDLVRRVSPGPRIDIFSREARDGFDQFGNETHKFKEEANG